MNYDCECHMDEWQCCEECCSGCAEKAEEDFWQREYEIAICYQQKEEQDAMS